MIIWMSLIAPIIGAGVLLFWFREKLTWWEPVLPIVFCLIISVIFKFTVEKVQVSDTEYWGSLGVTAEYYEPWSTWVEETCTRTYSCNCDSKGNCQTCTETYDCSYCDDHGPQWVLVTSLGERIAISEEKFNELSRRWHSTPEFVNMHRSIEHHGSCGQDGNMYRIVWDKQPITSEPTASSHSYENRIKAAHSAFDFADINKDDIKQYGLYDYPGIQGYTQKCLLGAENVQWLSSPERDTLEKLLRYMNGEMGPRKQLKVWVLVFQDQPELAAHMQEAYWKGGNKNEMVICLGLSSHTNNLQWVKAFSWTPNRTLLVDIREDLMKQEKFSGSYFYSVLGKDLEGFQRRHFKEFSYLTVEPPMWCLILDFFLSLGITLGCGYWAITNDLVADKDNAWKTKETWRNRW